MRELKAASDMAPLPYRIDQLVLAHDTVMVANQMDENVENLRLDRDRLAATTQLVLAEIDFELVEAEIHDLPLVQAPAGVPRDRSVMQA
jgi:hypothetical protein